MLVLTPEEVQMVLNHRKQIEDQKALKKIQETCDHNWRWVCCCHNDDAYDCTKCGATKYE